MSRKRQYVDLVIIGAGVTGAGVAYACSQYTNAKSIVVLEQYGKAGDVNSHPSNNSQTLHEGPQETNYDLAHALKMKDAATLTVNYVRANPAPGLYRKLHKMVVAVGAEEVAMLRARYETFRPHYPGLELLEAADLAKLEPAVMAGRDPKQPVVALLTREGYAINYQLLAQSFLQRALGSGRQVDVRFDEKVHDITRQADGTFIVTTGNYVTHAKTVVVCAGPYSMLFAQAMGYAEDLAFVQVAGSFYFANSDLLNGKVYTVQDENLPFAAVHGDPDVVVPNQTRFGPTAKVLPMLERHRYNTVLPYLRTPIRRVAGLLTLAALARNPVFAGFVAKNLFYDLPFIGKLLYLRQMRKVVPTLRRRDVRLGKKMGGVRPQIVNTKQRTMQTGESMIVEGGIIFITTPSPGASVALKNAETVAQLIVGFLGRDYRFDQTAFDRELRKNTRERETWRHSRAVYLTGPRQTAWAFSIQIRM